MGIDAVGPRPAAEPGSYHQLVDATEHRVPVLEGQPGTEHDGTEMGKASSYHVFAPPMRENLHMDEARKRRAAVHCNRYDFSFRDPKSRRTAWHGTNASKEQFLRTGLDPVSGGYTPFPSSTEKRQGATKYAAEVMAERTRDEAGIRKQLLEHSQKRLLEESWNDSVQSEGNGVENLAMQAEILASIDRSSVRPVRRERAPELWKGKGKDPSASLVDTERMFELSDHTNLPDGTLTALCRQERRTRAGLLRPRAREATTTDTGRVLGGQNLSVSRSISSIGKSGGKHSSVTSGASAVEDGSDDNLSRSLIPLEPRQVSQVGFALQVYAGQPLAARGAIRALRGEPRRPLPDPRGPPRKQHPKGRFRTKHGYGKFDDRGLFPEQTSQAHELPEKPHWSTPVSVEDYMPSKEMQKKVLERAAQRAVVM